MKAVESTLAHAHTPTSPLPESSYPRPREDVTDEEDFEIEDTDCAVINRSTEVQRVRRVVPVNGKCSAHPQHGSHGNGMGPYINLKELNGDGKSDVIWTTPQSDIINNGSDVCLNGKSPYTNGVVSAEERERVVENGVHGGKAATERAESPVPNWDRTVAEMKEHAFSRLQEELKKAHQELKLRDEEVTRLSRIRQDVESELEDLTASLFQEAHNMVREANVKHAAAERAFKESQMQVDVLTAEVAALKTLVLTSTPSRPNPHLHPQIDLRGNRSKDDSSLGGAASLFNKKHRRSPSHFNLKYGRENSPPESPVREAQSLPPDDLNGKEAWEVDPDVHREFTTWRQSPKLDKADPFIARIYSEEINLCLDFPNCELGAQVRDAVETGNIFIEAVSDKSKTVFPKKCALLEVPRQCHYRMKFGDQEQWYCMSQICRNRIIAVCDFLNYLKYIERGLVKSSAHDVYWQITRLRKDMVLARLGLALAS